MAGVYAAGDAGHAGGKFPERGAIGKDRAYQARAGGCAGHGASRGCSGAGVDADGRAEGGACGGEARAGAETDCACRWAVVYAVEAAAGAVALVRKVHSLTCHSRKSELQRLKPLGIGAVYVVGKATIHKAESRTPA